MTKTALFLGPFCRYSGRHGITNQLSSIVNTLYLVCSIVQTAIAVLLSLLIMIAKGKLVTSENNISKISLFLSLTALLTKFIKLKKYI